MLCETVGLIAVNAVRCLRVAVSADRRPRAKIQARLGNPRIWNISHTSLSLHYCVVEYCLHHRCLFSVPLSSAHHYFAASWCSKRCWLWLPDKQCCKINQYSKALGLLLCLMSKESQLLCILYCTVVYLCVLLLLNLQICMLSLL